MVRGRIYDAKLVHLASQVALLWPKCFEALRALAMVGSTTSSAKLRVPWLLLTPISMRVILKGNLRLLKQNCFYFFGGHEYLNLDLLFVAFNYVTV